jgi:hypothetical protein
MILRLRDSQLLNQLLIFFLRPFTEEDFSLIIHLTLLLVLTKMEKESFMGMMLLEVTVATELLHKEQELI